MMLKYWLWMVMVFGASNPKIWSVINVTKTPERAYSVLKDASQHQRFSLNDRQRRAAFSVTMDQVDKVLENCEKKDISVTYFDDEKYPQQLKDIYNPPAVLFYQGDMDILRRYPTVTVVGTRKPTDYSVHVTAWICRDLARADVTVVSGFAVGLDSVAHRSTILSGGRTAAVLGCGIDVNYPRENSSAKRYIATNGLLLTEFLPGTEPLPRNFPARNRILSGISLGTLVIQAPEKSGSLITASLALEQGKSVFCIPPADLFDNRYAGVVKYLRDGAIPVFSYLDIINEYYPVYTHKLKPSVLFEASHSAEGSVLSVNSGSDEQRREASVHEKTQEKLREEKQSDSERENVKEENAQVKQKKEENTKKFRDFSALDGLELKIAVLLSQEHQLHVDEIVERLDADENEVASALTELSIDGYVVRFTGQCYGIL